MTPILQDGDLYRICNCPQWNIHPYPQHDACTACSKWYDFRTDKVWIAGQENYQITVTRHSESSSSDKQIQPSLDEPGDFGSKNPEKDRPRKKTDRKSRKTTASRPNPRKKPKGKRPKGYMERILKALKRLGFIVLMLIAGSTNAQSLLTREEFDEIAHEKGHERFLDRKKYFFLRDTLYNAYKTISADSLAFQVIEPVYKSTLRSQPVRHTATTHFLLIRNGRTFEIEREVDLKPTLRSAEIDQVYTILLSEDTRKVYLSTATNIYQYDRFLGQLTEIVLYHERSPGIRYSLMGENTPEIFIQDNILFCKKTFKRPWGWPTDPLGILTYNVETKAIKRFNEVSIDGYLDVSNPEIADTRRIHKCILKKNGIRYDVLMGTINPIAIGGKDPFKPSIEVGNLQPLRQSLVGLYKHGNGEPGTFSRIRVEGFDVDPSSVVLKIRKVTADFIYLTLDMKTKSNQIVRGAYRNAAEYR